MLFVNCLHHELTETECGEYYPFGGTQIVLVGEFLQLRPVPEKFDDGMLMFLSNVYKFVVPHQIQLIQIMHLEEKSLLRPCDNLGLDRVPQKSVISLPTCPEICQVNYSRTHSIFSPKMLQLFFLQQIDCGGSSRGAHSPACHICRKRQKYEMARPRNIVAEAGVQGNVGVEQISNTKEWQCRNFQGNAK